MNVLLIYPEFPDTFWSFKHALKLIGQKALSPPLGLLTVAAMLPSDWPKRLVDMNVRDVTSEDLTWADCAFVSGMIVQKESARAIVARCKQAGIEVVAGGPLFTSEYEQFEDVDHFVLNEAEVTLPLFLTDLEHGSLKRIYQTSDFADMTKTPIPLWDLADLEQYNLMSIQFSRGCPFDCEFCNVTTLFGHEPRHKTKDQIIAELDSLYYDQGWRGGVFFVDDNLIGNKKYFKSELLPSLIEWQKNKGNIPFNTQVSINLADDERMMEMMYEAGFDLVFIGIETPDENALGECNKKQNLNRDLGEDVLKIQQAGLQVQGGFVIGFDSDESSIFERQVDFIEKSKIVTATVGLLQAWPDTRLYNRLKAEGRLLEKMSGDNVDGTTNIIPKMQPEILYQGYSSILKHIYAPSHYYHRAKAFMEGCKPPKVQPQWKFGDILLVLRSMYFLGVLGKERLQYWRFMFWTLSHRPKLLSLAITFAISGYHFRRVCELRVLMK